MISSQHGIAVVTGAAGGLGACFANKLAERGHHLLLVDRRPEQLEQVCESIADRHGVSVQPHTADLGKRDEVQQLAQRLQELPDIELLVNNAGFGSVDYFADTDVNYLVGMADLHVVTPTILTRAVLPGMIERDRGGIINVSSLGAFFHSAGNAQYGATKSYLTSFSMSLRDELRGTNVCVQALCPGFVRTEFHAAQSMKSFSSRCNIAANMWLTAEEVVDCSLAKLSNRQVLVFPSLKYRLVGRLAQIPMLRPLMQRITRLSRAVPAEAQSEEPCDCPAPEAEARVVKQAESGNV